MGNLIRACDIEQQLQGVFLDKEAGFSLPLQSTTATSEGLVFGLFFRVEKQVSCRFSYGIFGPTSCSGENKLVDLNFVEASILSIAFARILESGSTS